MQQMINLNELPQKSIVPEMVLISSGFSFEMGAELEEVNNDELPVHTVDLDGFYTDVHGVPNTQCS